MTATDKPKAPGLLDGKFSPTRPLAASGNLDVSRTNPFVLALGDVVGRLTSGESMSVGRDGASDAVSFLRAGVPAVAATWTTSTCRGATAAPGPRSSAHRSV